MAMCFLFRYYGSTQANEVTYGEKLMGLGSGRMIEMISLHFIYTYVLSTEVQGISFVGYTGVVGGRPRLWNLQNLCPVPPELVKIEDERNF